MKKKALIYTVIFAGISFILNIINSQIEKSKLKNLIYNEAKIYNYTLVSKNSERIVVKGQLLIDKLKFLEGKDIKAEIIKDGKKIYIIADYGTFDKKEILNLKDNVQITTDEIRLTTPNILFNIKKDFAYNSITNKILTKNMETTGKNIFIDLKSEKILLKKVKTKFYEGNNG